MKKYMRRASIILMLSFLGSAVYAQHDHSGQQKEAAQLIESSQQMGGMMGMMQEMMGKMMNDPIKRSSMLIHIIPTMKEALELTDAQLEGLMAASKTYKTMRQDLEEKTGKAEAELEKLWQSEEVDPARVKALMLEIGELRVGIKALTYETAVDMRSQLSEKQRASLDKMKPMQLHHHMMTKMTMMEMMHAMHGEGMMGSESMSQGGMKMGKSM